MVSQSQARPRLSHAVLLEMKRWNTPTIYNGWEQITRHNASHEGFNLEETRDFMPQMGPMVGYAVTVQIQPGSIEPRLKNPAAGPSTGATSRVSPALRSSSSKTWTSRQPMARFGAR
jgi:hypothetical protein